MKYNINIYISSRCLGLHQWLIIMKHSINMYVSSRDLGLHKWFGFTRCTSAVHSVM